MKNRHASINIKMLLSDKLALVSYAQSQGESISVIVRKLIKEELKKTGFIQPAKSVEMCDSQEHNLETKLS